MELPQDLQLAIENELESLPTGKLAAATSRLSQRYRSGLSSSRERFLQSPEDVSAYGAFRLPATFAAVYSALRQIRDQIPAWSPVSMLDVGAGPGTAMWATAALWPDMEQITLLEHEDGMIALGKRLSRFSPLPAIRESRWQKADITAPWDIPPQDLVATSYVLGELPEGKRTAFIDRLWASTRGILIIIEPGTPRGFSHIRQAREQLLHAHAQTIAPCPHDGSCSMKGDNWCHFSQRVSRSRMHRQVKAGDLGYEDEKFSFIAMSRISGQAIEGRIIRHPQIRKGHVQIELCTSKGLSSITISRKDGELYHKARDLGWGDPFPFPSSYSP